MRRYILILLFFPILSIAENPNHDEEVMKKLINTLKNVKAYKLKKNQQIERLNHKIKSLNSELKKVKAQLLESQKKLKRKERLEKMTIETPMEEIPLAPIESADEEILPWVEIVVENGEDIYQLALKYYGNREAYHYIYNANQHIIHQNLIIEDGMSLKIPITESFEEQPIILNQH